MKLHIITIGRPKLDYAKQGFRLYTARLSHYHALNITHIPDKNNNADSFNKAINGLAYAAMVIGGKQLNSGQLAKFLDNKAIQHRELCFVIGGPEGLPTEIIDNATYQLGLSELTFPHDLAMLVLAEALYRASSINAGSKYHK